MRYCLRIAVLALLFSALTGCVPLPQHLPLQPTPAPIASPLPGQVPTPEPTATATMSSAVSSITPVPRATAAVKPGGVQFLDLVEAADHKKDALVGMKMVCAQSAATPALSAARTAPLDLNNCPNIADCVTRYEQSLLAAGVPGVERVGKQLRILHANGATSVFTDTEGQGGGGWATYRYLGYLPEIAQHLVFVGYYEGGDFILLAARDGAVTVVWNIPFIAPDKQHFAIAGGIPDSPGSGTLRVQTWRVEQASLVLEHSVEIEYLGYFMYHRLVREWTSADTLRIFAVTEDGRDAGAGVVTVHLGSDGPVAAFDGTPIPQPVLYDQMVVSENHHRRMGLVEDRQFVFALDTLAVGKRVYNDRDYRFTEVSPELVSAQYFLFNNGLTRETDSSYIHFHLFGPATLYVAIDAQTISLPGWMDEGWLPSEGEIGTDDIPMKLYKKEYGLGEVSLGSNWMPPAAGIRSHYLLLVMPRKP